MIHYTCDRCRRQINPAEQTRYVVQIEIQSAAETPSSEIDEEVDQLAELHEILEGMIDEEMETGCPATSHRGRYDLCSDCHRQFLQNPLGRDAMLAIGFSDN